MNLELLKYITISVMLLFLILLSYICWIFIKNETTRLNIIYKNPVTITVTEILYKFLRIKKIRNFIRSLFNLKKEIDVIELLNQAKNQKNNDGVD